MRLTKVEWNKNKETYIWVFDVGRGFSSFVKTPFNHGMMIDCGAREDFSPTKDVVAKWFLPCVDKPVNNGRIFPLAQLVVTHPHSDHCLEIADVMKHAYPMLLTTPHSNPKESDANQHVDWSLVSNPEGGQECVNILKSQAHGRVPPLKPYLEELGITIPGFELKIFFIPPHYVKRDLPKADYANNLSIMVYVKTGAYSILFCGDMMASGMEYILRTQREFCQLLSSGLTVVVVPHHGLESAYCPLFWQTLRHGKSLALNVISDKRALGENEGCTAHQYLSGNLSRGHDGRYSLSTKADGHIRIILGAGNKLDIKASKDIGDLLES